MQVFKFLTFCSVHFHVQSHPSLLIRFFSLREAQRKWEYTWGKVLAESGITGTKLAKGQQHHMH